MNCRGSVLLLCMAVISVLVVIAYGFVRVLQMQGKADDSTTHQILAREAASMGVNHAIEQIIRDYISEPFTRLDGPARKPFLVHEPLAPDTRVNRWWNCQDTDNPGNRLDIDDVSSGRCLFGPIFSTWWLGGWQQADLTFTASYGSSLATVPRGMGLGGHVSYDGRGRYYEPNFYNRDLAQPIRFGDPAIATLPERNKAIFFDERWQRLTDPPLVARSKARYRLRYAVGVMDLDGEILVSPDPALDYRQIVSPDPRTYADPSLARVVRAGHALAPMISSVGKYGPSTYYFSNDIPEIHSAGVTAGVRAEHVFLGRGYASNFEQMAATGDAPVTFPYMYRRAGQPGSFGLADTVVPGRIAEDLYFPAGTPAGGDLLGLTAGTMPGNYRLRRSLIGAPFSFRNFEYAVLGGWGDRVGTYIGYDGWLRATGCFTPFGRGLSIGMTSRFRGPVDTPWSVNVMTAPVKVVNAMLAAYLPPGAMSAYCYDGAAAPANRHQYRPLYNSSRDLFVKEMSPAFAKYDAPRRTVPSVIAPDYHVRAIANGDAGYREPKARYPGPMAFNGYPLASTIWSNDSLGKFLRASGTPAAPVKEDRVAMANDDASCGAMDPYSGLPFFHAFYNFGATNSTPNTEDMPDGNPIGVRTHPDSIWSAVCQAMAAAIAMARGQYLDQATAVADPTTWFDGHAWVAASDGPLVTSIRDIDALFLRNLGIDIADPANAAVASSRARKAYTGDTSSAVGMRPVTRLRAFTPAWNIAGLRILPEFADAGYTSAQRSEVVELIVNDMRLSFFGSSPAYGGFEALDLNGDGKVTCSGLASSGVAAEKDLGIDQHQAGTRVAVGTYFSNTGVFIIGKSRFWRVMTRGEVWDNVLQTTISEALLDTVVSVDPVDRAKEWQTAPSPAANPAAGQFSTHVIYQRWFYDLYRGHLSRRE